MNRPWGSLGFTLSDSFYNSEIFVRHERSPHNPRRACSYCNGNKVFYKDGKRIDPCPHCNGTGDGELK